MRKILVPVILLLPLLYSCKQNTEGSGSKIITVSIAPYKYFIKEISGDDFIVNIMVPPGSNPHIYEPYPEQIANLRKSIAYVCNGYLDFELTWLDRFYEINPSIIKLNTGSAVSLIGSVHSHDGEHNEGVDPHYWVSPGCARLIAGSVKELLTEINPEKEEIYGLNFQNLMRKIDTVDSTALALFSGDSGRSFMIYHPNLAYLARDFGLEEIAVESEGKEPSPSMLKDLIDLAADQKYNTIFVQKEFDIKNARSIADEIGAEVYVIDPLAEDWYGATMEIIKALDMSFNNNANLIPE